LLRDFIAGHLECVRLLLKAGAQVNVKNEAGETALMLAAFEVSFLSSAGTLLSSDRQCREAVLELLLASGAEVSHQSREKKLFALLLATLTGRTRYVRSLVV
jgi:ankyrin repeat protein